MTDSKIKLFICADDNDLRIAERLHDDLNQEGISPWLDSRNLLPGQNRELEVNRAIKQSNYFLAILSFESVSKRGFVQEKLKKALKVFEEFSEGEIFIIPIRTGECNLPDSLEKIHHVDLFPSYDRCVGDILQVVKSGAKVSETVKETQDKNTVEDGAGAVSRKTEKEAKSLNRHLDNKMLSPLAYAVISLVAIAVGIGVLFLYVSKADYLIALGIGMNVFYVLLIPLGLSAAAFLFGAMSSIALYQGNVMDGRLRLGGPVVVFVLVIIMGFKLVPQETLPFAVTVFVRGPNMEQKIEGEMRIDLGGDPRVKEIGKNGNAYFMGIPAMYRGKDVTITVNAKGYKMADPGKTYMLKSQGIYVDVVRDDSLAKVFGTVRSSDGDFLKDVKIQIWGLQTLSKENGYFELDIPPEKQRKKQKLLAWHDRYELWDNFVYPGTGTGVDIILQKKK